MEENTNILPLQTIVYCQCGKTGDQISSCETCNPKKIWVGFAQFAEEVIAHLLCAALV